MSGTTPGTPDRRGGLPPNETMDSPADVHLPWFWTMWRRNQQWRENLAKKAAHKSLDIPDDDMQIHNTRTGISAGGAIGIAAAAGIPGAIASGILGYSLLTKPSEVPAPEPSQPTVSCPAVPDSEYDVLFYDKDGNPISVPHISTRPKTAPSPAPAADPGGKDTEAPLFNGTN